MKMVHITIHTEKLSESVEFYENVLGMETQARFQGVGGKSIAFLGSRDSDVRIELIEDEAGYNGTGISMGFHVKDVEALREWMEAKNLNPSPMLCPNVDTRFFFIQDPNGVSIQFIS